MGSGVTPPGDPERLVQASMVFARAMLLVNQRTNMPLDLDPMPGILWIDHQ